jgi:hypothetical protein
LNCSHARWCRAGFNFEPPTVARAAHFTLVMRARVFRLVAGYNPPSGSGSYQRVRGRRLHSHRSTRSCSELAGISRRSRRRKVACPALAGNISCPHAPPPPARSNNKLPTRTHHEPRQYTSFGRQMARRNTQNRIRLFGDFSTRNLEHIWMTRHTKAHLFRVPLALDVLRALACLNNNL